MGVAIFMGGDNGMGDKKNDGMIEASKGNAMLGISTAAIAVAGLLMLLVLALAFWLIFTAYGFKSTGFFWAGAAALVLAFVVYIFHMMTESAALVGATAVLGTSGVISVYYSIYLREGVLSDKVVPVILFSIVVIFLLFMVFRSARTAGEQKQREALRRKT